MSEDRDLTRAAEEMQITTLIKVHAGLTSVEEVLRVLGPQVVE